MIRVKADDMPVQPEYPVLKISPRGNIVLFVSKGCGTLVSPGPDSNLPVGDYSKSWVEKWFTLFKGKVELSNV